MHITKIEQNFTSNSRTENKKSDFLNKFHEKTRNSADMTDKKVSRGLSLAGALTSLYGTWAFVRPFIIKDCNGVEHKK